MKRNHVDCFANWHPRRSITTCQRTCQMVINARRTQTTFASTEYARFYLISRSIKKKLLAKNIKVALSRAINAIIC